MGGLVDVRLILVMSFILIKCNHTYAEYLPFRTLTSHIKPIPFHGIIRRLINDVLCKRNVGLVYTQWNRFGSIEFRSVLELDLVNKEGL